MALGLYEVIQYSGRLLACRYPVTEFNTYSQLHVNEGQIALTCDDGVLSDLFTPGRYSLVNENIPILKGFLSFLGNGTSPYHCSVYFVNTTQKYGKWGMGDLSVRVYAPVYDRLPIKLGFSGSISYRISDARALISKMLLCNGKEVLRDEDALLELNEIASSYIRSRFSNMIQEMNVNVLDIYSHLEQIETALKNVMTPVYMERGVEICELSIDAIAEDDELNSIRDTISNETGIVLR